MWRICYLCSGTATLQLEKEIAWNTNRAKSNLFVLAVTTSSDCTFIHSRVYRNIYIGLSLHTNCHIHEKLLEDSLPFFPVDIFKTWQTVVTFFFCWRSCHTTAISSRRQRLWLLVAQTAIWCAKSATFWPEFCNVFIASKRLKDPYPSWKKHPPLNRGSCRSCRWSRVRR